MDNGLRRFKGQYIREDDKSKKPKVRKGNELQSVTLRIYSHNGKIPNHGGAL
jgi:hypothetical protein